MTETRRITHPSLNPLRGLIPRTHKQKSIKRVKDDPLSMLNENVMIIVTSYFQPPEQIMLKECDDVFGPFVGIATGVTLEHYQRFLYDCAKLDLPRELQWGIEVQKYEWDEGTACGVTKVAAEYSLRCLDYVKTTSFWGKEMKNEAACTAAICGNLETLRALGNDKRYISQDLIIAAAMGGHVEVMKYIGAEKYYRTDIHMQLCSVRFRRRHAEMLYWMAENKFVFAQPLIEKMERELETKDFATIVNKIQQPYELMRDYVIGSHTVRIGNEESIKILIDAKIMTRDMVEAIQRSERTNNDIYKLKYAQEFDQKTDKSKRLLRVLLGCDGGVGNIQLLDWAVNVKGAEITLDMMDAVVQTWNEPVIQWLRGNGYDI